MEEIRQKATIGVEKRHVARGVDTSFLDGGGRINIVFGPKYRPPDIHIVQDLRAFA
jgi:hypothetical protein